MAKEKRQLMRRMLRALDLPEEADAGVLKVTMLGKSDLLIENHRGILQYQGELVRLMTPEGVVRITGKGLILSEFGGERVYIRGMLTGWGYEDAEPCGN